MLRRPRPLFRDRADAGRRLAHVLAPLAEDAVVVGLARGGVVVAAEVARELDRPLDALAVRKVGHTAQPEFAIGAVAAGSEPYIRGHETLTPDDVRDSVEAATRDAESLDETLHATAAAHELDGRACALVDDGLATGATMIAATIWARARGAREVTVAVPVGARQTAATLERRSDRVVCLETPRGFMAVGLYYEDFGQVSDGEVTRLLDESRSAENP